MKTSNLPITMGTHLQILLLVLSMLLGFFISSKFALGNDRRAQTSFTHVANIKFDGICDGSAAVRLDKDSILVAYDEKNALFAYSIQGGKPIAQVELAQLLDLPAGKENDEIDIEAAVRDGNKIWWIGSHGQNKNGKDRPNRRMIFSTNFPNKTLQNIHVINTPTDLTKVLLADPIIARILTKEVRSKPPKEGGVNIEGLAKHPSGGLIVGFRSPLNGPHGHSGDAIAAHITEQNGSFLVKKVYTLDLGNRGFRDLVSHRNGFLLIAGAVGKRGNSVLFNWHEANDTIKQVSGPFKGINPEALVQINQQWLVLSDDGKQKRPDESAADGDRKCDKIRKKHGETHPSVYFNAVILSFGLR